MELIWNSSGVVELVGSGAHLELVGSGAHLELVRRSEWSSSGVELFWSPVICSGH